MNVSVKYVGVFRKWYVCHASSGQNAFRSSINGFATKQEAADFAKNRGCIVVCEEDQPSSNP